MKTSEKIKFISNWIKDYANNMPSRAQSLVIGISGGIDSSLITALLQSQQKNPISSFTISFPDDNFSNKPV